MSTIHHKFHSAKGDGPDATLVKPSAWDDDHDFQTTATTPIVLGRQTPGAGPIEELPLNVIFPTGFVGNFAGPAAPPGWLLCYGQAVNQADYPGLYAVIGTTYGAGPGPATFQVPDLRGVATVGKSNMGGADRGNLPGGATLGQYLGAPSVGVNFNSTNNVGFDFGNVAFTQTYGAITTAGSSAGGNAGGSQYAYLNDQVTVQGYSRVVGTFAIGVYGQGTTVGIVQPSVVMNKIIKT